ERSGASWGTLSYLSSRAGDPRCRTLPGNLARSVTIPQRQSLWRVRAANRENVVRVRRDHMQASYTFRRLPATRVITLAMLAGALVFGGLAGYVLRAAGEPSAAGVSTQAQVRQSSWSPS